MEYRRLSGVSAIMLAGVALLVSLPTGQASLLRRGNLPDVYVQPVEGGSLRPITDVIDGHPALLVCCGTPHFFPYIEKTEQLMQPYKARGLEVLYILTPELLEVFEQRLRDVKVRAYTVRSRDVMIKNFQIQFSPHTAVLDKDGGVLWAWSSAAHPAELRTYLEALLTPDAPLPLTQYGATLMYVRSLPDFDFSGKAALYTQLLRPDVWKVVANDEFERTAQLRESERILREDVAQVAAARLRTLEVSVTLGEYDFSSSAFPLTVSGPDEDRATTVPTPQVLQFSLGDYGPLVGQKYLQLRIPERLQWRLAPDEAKQFVRDHPKNRKLPAVLGFRFAPATLAGETWIRTADATLDLCEQSESGRSVLATIPWPSQEVDVGDPTETRTDERRAAIRQRIAELEAELARLRALLRESSD